MAQTNKQFAATIKKAMKARDEWNTDERKLADAFIQIYRAAMVINEVLGNNDALNESIPKNWPLNLSADEFAWGLNIIQNWLARIRLQP